ncbi:hypothetical protein [Streptomyces sp. NBC_00236]|uniref:hypothetical protein n=1 Tax=unclassified Streptomyces TaxID=2593676 RepID=UPI002E29CB0F|nr:hypothetical protein [Streptomyces sp. NBC_00236]
MATIPGIRAAQAQDVLNRPVIGIHLPGECDLLLLDAETPLYAGGAIRTRRPATP